MGHNVGFWRVRPGLLLVLSVLGGAALYATGRFAETLMALAVLGLVVGVLTGSRVSGAARPLGLALALPVLSLIAYLAIAVAVFILKILLLLAALALALALLWALIYFLRGRL